MKLWLDDVRDPAPRGFIGWVWVKTAAEAIDLFLTGEVEQASLDHDLGPEHMLAGYRELQKLVETGGPVRREDLEAFYGPGTGYDVVLWLEAHPSYYPAGGVTVHSMNPVGARRMRVALDGIRRRKAKNEWAAKNDPPKNSSSTAEAGSVTPTDSTT